MEAPDYDPWPDSLVEELADRRAIIVMGAGASAGAFDQSNNSPPTWPKLLSSLGEHIKESTDQQFVESLVQEKRFLDAAQIIVDKIDMADFSRVIKEMLKKPKFEPSEFHKNIYEIDPKIVVTTNYDEIYENYCKKVSDENSHNVCKYYETHILNDIRSPTRCIVKAHGCVSDPARIILSRSSYFNAQRNSSDFFSVLNSVFLTNTVLFVGCGLEDPDINLILENTNIAAPSQHTHYALVPKGRHSSIAGAYQTTYNLKLIEYEDPTHQLASSALQALKTRVLSSRAFNAIK